jgi:hypothetical protein
MDIKNTVTALQIAAGVQVYEIRFTSERTYYVKSEQDISAGAYALVRGKGGAFVAGKVIGKANRLNLSDDNNMKWVLAVTGDLDVREQQYIDIDCDAANRIAQARVMREAAQVAEMSGLSVSDFAVSASGAANKVIDSDGRE